jgi:hypothetical protein
VTRWRADRLGLPAPVGLTRRVLLAAASVPGLARGTAPSLALVGETLDRASFYATLEPASPRQMMAEAIEPSKPRLTRRPSLSRLSACRVGA